MTSAPPSCCAQVQCENRLLRRALRKERERRQFIGEAYKELLRSYERLLDLKNIIDLPSPSLSLTSSVDDTQPPQQQKHEQSSSSNNQTKSNRNGIIQQVINNKPNQQLPPSIATTGATRSRQPPFTTSPNRIQIQSFIAEYRAAEQRRQQNGGTGSNEGSKKQTTSFFDQNIGAQTQKRYQSSTSTISNHVMSPMRKLSSSTYVVKKAASPARTYVIEETPPSPARNVAAVEPAALVDPQHQRVIDFESDDPSHQQVPVQQSPILVPSTPPLMLHRSPLQAPLPPPWDPSRTHSVPKAKTASAMASRRTGTVRTLLVDNNNNKATTTPTNGGTNGGNSNTTVAKAMMGHHNHTITGMGVGVGSPHRFRAPLGDSTAAVNNRNGQPKLTSKPERVIAIDDDDEDEDKDHDAVDSPDDNLQNVEQSGGGNGEAKALEVMRNFAPLQAADQQKQSTNWYFVPLFMDENAGGNMMRRRSMELQPNLTTLDQQHRLSILVARSQARCQAIAKASRRRTILAARRRAVVADLVQGVRPLDATAMAIIHMDTSRISAFPALMQQMRDNSRRLFFKTSPIHRRLEQEQQRKLDQATNRIMAHSSAVITKMMAKSRLSRGFE